MTVLVTGAGGFVGSAVVRELAAASDERVVGFDRVTQPANAPATIWVQGDLADRALLSDLVRDYQISDVVHTAALVGVPAGNRSVAATLAVNVVGMASILETAAHAGVRRFVETTTEEIYGDFARDPMPEDGPCAPLSAYGTSKLAAEQVGGFFRRTCGVEYVAARLCAVYGPAFPRARTPDSWVLDAAAGRTSPDGGDPAFQADFTYVDDAASGVVALLHADQLAHDAYHVSRGEARSLADWKRILQNLAPDWNVEFQASEQRARDGSRLARKGALDIARMRVLGWEPRVSLEDGLARTLAAARFRP